MTSSTTMTSILSGPLYVSETYVLMRVSQRSSVTRKTCARGVCVRSSGHRAAEEGGGRGAERVQERMHGAASELVEASPSQQQPLLPLPHRMSYGGVELQVEGATLTCLKPAARSRSSNWNERRWRLATGSRTEGICSVSGYRFSPSLQLAMITACTGIAAPSWSSPAERARAEQREQRVARGRGCKDTDG